MQQIHTWHMCKTQMINECFFKGEWKTWHMWRLTVRTAPLNICLGVLLHWVGAVCLSKGHQVGLVFTFHFFFSLKAILQFLPSIVGAIFGKVWILKCMSLSLTIAFINKGYRIHRKVYGRELLKRSHPSKKYFQSLIYLSWWPESRNWSPDGLVGKFSCTFGDFILELSCFSIEYRDL